MSAKRSRRIFNKHRRKKSRHAKPTPQTPAAAVAERPSTSEEPIGSLVRFVGFGPEGLTEVLNPEIGKLSDLCKNFAVAWIDVEGFANTATLRRIGETFDLHPLAMEDVVSSHQRPKIEAYEKHLFLVARAARFRRRAELEQIGMFLGKNYVITFQEFEGDSFEPTRERIRKSVGRIRQGGADYLAYALLDAVIDTYFPLVDRYADRLDAIEDDITERLPPDVTARAHATRNDILTVRRAVRSHRDAITELLRDGHPLIGEDTHVFFRDCYDHTIQLTDQLDAYREICTDLRDYYLSLVNNRMNEVMKLLTIIATIFIPLSFVTGLYGMNFNTELPGNMPELNVPFGYVGALVLMGSIAFGLLYFFWRKGWLRSLAIEQRDAAKSE